MYNYERFQVEVSQDRLSWDDPPRSIVSLTPEEWALYLPILRINGKLRRVPYYPLYELGTEVKLKFNQQVGKITYTYNNNGKNLKPTSDHSYDWTVIMNDDRYGVEAHGMVRFVKPSDFLVRNPNTNRWQDVGQSIGDLLTKAKDLELSDTQIDRLLKIASDLVAKGGPTVTLPEISQNNFQTLREKAEWLFKFVRKKDRSYPRKMVQGDTAVVSGGSTNYGLFGEGAVGQGENLVDIPDRLETDDEYFARLNRIVEMLLDSIRKKFTSSRGQRLIVQAALQEKFPDLLPDSFFDASNPQWSHFTTVDEMERALQEQVDRETAYAEKQKVKRAHYDKLKQPTGEGRTKSQMRAERLALETEDQDTIEPEQDATEEEGDQPPRVQGQEKNRVADQDPDDQRARHQAEILYINDPWPFWQHDVG